MNTYTVLENDGTPVQASAARRREIVTILREYIAEPTHYLRGPEKRIPRKLKHFSQHVEIEIINSDNKPYTTIEINCPDQPGVLASIGKVFAQHNIQLQNARIATLGERVEDLFYVLNSIFHKITDPEQIESIKSDLKQELGR
jgi:[protein-PII] uridylyltransferase